MGAPGTAARLAADPKAVADLERTVELAQSLESPSLFDGLRAARQLAEGQTDFDLLALRIQEKVKSSLLQGIIESSSARQRLAALERFRQGLADGISRRVALERLALEMNHV
jgi:hypothetical protein